jgi:hypothetical protein
MLRGKYQASLEFLTTYGWAIAIVILVLAILFSTGIFSFSSSIPNSISGFSSTPVSSVAANPTALEMDVGNNVGQPINITGIVVNSSGHSYSSFSCQNNYIYPGQSTICYVSGSFSNPAYISAEIIYYIATSKKIYLSSTGSIVVSLSKVLVPVGVKYYVPITIKNTQTSPTPNPFQQMINISSSSTPWAYINTSQSSYFGQNVEFFYSNGEVIPSWLEQYHSGYAIWWIKIGNIPSSSSITIYMGFASKATNLFNGNTIGEAPQLSSTYAEYDDGANVFNNYWNFAGTRLPSGISSVTSDGSVIVNNGVILKGSTSETGGENGIYTTSSFSAPIIVDYYGTQSTSPQGDVWGDSEPGFSNYIAASDGSPNGGGTFTLVDFEGSPGGTNVNSQASPSTSQGGTENQGILPNENSGYSVSVWTQIYTSSSYYTYQNYVNNTGDITGASNTASLPFVIMVGNNEATYAPNGMTVYWLRTRAYPPNGVMPSVTFGSVS